MAYRFYIMPKAGTGVPHVDPFRMKYIDNANGTRQIVGHATGLDYGVQPLFLVAADVTGTEHTAIAANADVLAAPLNIDNTIGAGNLTTVVNSLESVGLPAEWVTAGMTWRAMLLWLSRLFAFAQRYNGLYGTTPFLNASTDLDLQLGAVPSAARDRYYATAASFGFETSKLSSTMTIRQAFALALAVVPEGQLAGIL
jgi:hypothetical protein